MMGITIRDLIDEGAALQIRCTGCGKTYVYQGDFHLRTVAVLSMRMRNLQRLLRCGGCGAAGEVVLSFPCMVVDEGRRTPKPIDPRSQVGPGLWR
ncbi:hypothetical protein [Paracoccus siganidrum]|uniref:Uncharacterized protein n=1 Tax=Paracoccus siganidrum TaxID=1276757 RepID=A0A419A3R0_9RHOB|nr:hypothetical protein [Paracoccus siganidrum]RJL08393.1 hypothetical protein D3P05_16110 [Paracoccus siganidrum]RMC39305.1 hypothetical protein C9E82_04825 [Paracoccus siganidrum]